MSPSNKHRLPRRLFAYTLDSFTPFEWENSDQYEARAVKQLQAEQRRLKHRRLRPGCRPETPAEVAEMSTLYRRLAAWNSEIMNNIETLREKEAAATVSLGACSEDSSAGNCNKMLQAFSQNDKLKVGEIIDGDNIPHTTKSVHVLQNSASEKREWRRKFSCKYAESVTSTFYNSRMFSTQARGYGNSVGGNNMAWGGAFGPAPHSVTPQHSYRHHPSPGGTSRQVLENVDVQKRGDVDEEKLTSPAVDVISSTCSTVPRAHARSGTSSPIGLGLGAWKTCMPLVPPKAPAELAIADTCPAPAVAVVEGKGLAWDFPASLVVALLAIIEIGLRTRQLLTVHVDGEDVERVADLALAVGGDERSSCLVRVYSAVASCLWDPVDAPHALSVAALEAKRQVEARKTIWPMFWRGYRQQGEGDSARVELQRVLDAGHVAVIDSRAG